MKHIATHWGWYIWVVIVVLVMLPTKWDPAIRWSEWNAKVAKRQKEKRDERK